MGIKYDKYLDNQSEENEICQKLPEVSMLDLAGSNTAALKAARMLVSDICKALYGEMTPQDGDTEATECLRDELVIQGHEIGALVNELSIIRDRLRK